MDISLNKVQEATAKEARRFLKQECPPDHVREMSEVERGFSEEIWNNMAEMDWMRLRIPEDYDGLGMDQLDLTVLMEEMGHAALPGPFFSTVSLASEILVAAGSDSQKENYLPRIGDGSIRGTLALNELEGGADFSCFYMRASTDKDGFVLSGKKLFVPDANTANFLICAAHTEKGMTLFLIDLPAEGVSVTLLPSMDVTRRLCAVEFNNVHVKIHNILGEVHKGWEALRAVLSRAQVGICADSVGGAQRAMELSVEYAKTRYQFDQPIGSFQAIKHHCAKMFVQVESARSLLYWASWAQDHDSAEKASLSASVAKVYCSQTYINVTNSTLQVLGGVGFTWENDIHLYLKRAKLNEQMLGDPVFLRDQIVDSIAA